VPIEVLAKEKIEKLIEEKLKRILSDLQIVKKITELEASATKLTLDLKKLSAREGSTPALDLLTEALTKDLAGLGTLLLIQGEPDSVTLRTKTRLRDQDFRIVREIVSEHGGYWSLQKRMFIVPRNRSNKA